MERDTAITQINEHIRSIVNDLDSDGIRHVVIANGEDYIVIRSNNNVRAVTKLSISSRLLLSIPSSGDNRAAILGTLRDSMEEAESKLVLRRGRGGLNLSRVFAQDHTPGQTRAMSKFSKFWEKGKTPSEASERHVAIKSYTHGQKQGRYKREEAERDGQEGPKAG